MSKTLITEKQRKLILESETAKKSFKELYGVLLNINKLTYDDIRKNPALGNLASYYKELLNSCIAEWEVPNTKATNDLGANFRKHKRVCDLCNYKYLRIENIIINKITKKRLIIGSECAKEFGSDIVRHLEESRKYEKRARNIMYIEEKVPGISSFFESYRSYIESLEIMIPQTLCSKWEEVLYAIYDAYKKMRDSEGHIKARDIEEAKKLWEKKEALIKEIDSFILSHKNNKYIAKKSVFDWLKKQGNQMVIDRIREDGGYIQWFSAHRIYEENLMKEILTDLGKPLKELGVGVNSFHKGTRRVNLNFTQSRKSIVGTIKYKDLILECGGVLFGKKMECSFDHLYSLCYIEDWSSVEKVLSLTRNSDYRLSQKYMGDNELIFIGKNKYILINLDRAIKELKKYYFTNTLSIDQANRIIERLSQNVMSENEFKLYEEIKVESKKHENI